MAGWELLHHGCSEQGGWPEVLAQSLWVTWRGGAGDVGVHSGAKEQRRRFWKGGISHNLV